MKPRKKPYVQRQRASRSLRRRAFAGALRRLLANTLNKGRDTVHSKCIAPLGCGFAALVLLPLTLVCGCTGPRLMADPPQRPFEFAKDTFSYPNELLWEYGYNTNGAWTSHRREPKPSYAQHCFVVARSAVQFFENARFEPQLTIADERTYRRLIRRVVATNLRKPLSENQKIVIPGYADLRDFSHEQEKLLKHECGSSLQCYFQRGHWRMILPFTRREQERVAQHLLAHLSPTHPLIVHLVRFPSLTINHAVVVFKARPAGNQILFSIYDPNQPSEPRTLTFDSASRTFLLAANNYFPGGRVDVYEVYYQWDY